MKELPLIRSFDFLLSEDQFFKSLNKLHQIVELILFIDDIRNEYAYRSIILRSDDLTQIRALLLE